MLQSAFLLHLCQKGVVFACRVVILNGVVQLLRRCSYLSLGGLIAVQFDNKHGIVLCAYFPSFPVLPFVMKVRVHVWWTNKSRLNRVKDCNVGLEKFAGYSACTNIRRSKIGCPFCDRGPEQAREGSAFPITLARHRNVGGVRRFPRGRRKEGGIHACKAK